MTPDHRWLIWCAVSLCCLACFVSCRSGDGARTELFIFSELCALKDEPGPCKAIKTRYYFNIDTGQCEQFEYGGCGGNANNFASLEACQEMCIVSADKNPCHLGEAPGPCRGLLTRYFYDTRSQKCKHFFYGGCFGNANNFRSMMECQHKCQNPAKTTKAPEVNTLPVKPSRRVMPMPTEMLLRQTQPQVNKSDQHRKDFTPPEVCLSPVDSGSCNGAEKRFAYNPNTKRCHMFRYSGCGGNANNFSHRRHCIRKCLKIDHAHGTKMIRIRRKNINNILFRTA
ncbi:tissue factor pathway inhibitor a isoform X2 [Thalassophryne amazonica]|uniref:tissue factor pathway inhibitor a isoform X2 n=1 Tax=Thalassophryne amazonica TaxID=390379 RepID=UPI0014723D24|nr:tissue factor pathway inhibitor a isoform X2 [Thalassophryne amazonica]